MLTEGLRATVRGWFWGEHEALLISLGWALFILLTPASIGQFTMVALILAAGVSGALDVWRDGPVVWHGTMPIAAYTLTMTLTFSSGLRALVSLF